MSFSSAILRGVTGIFILNSGLGKRGLDREGATGLHGFASLGLPEIEDLDPVTFAKLVSTGEIAVASSLLIPFVPNKVAGLALTGFSAGLLSMYFRNSDNTLSDGIRPTPEGIDLAKDSWLTAIGLALIFFPNGDKKADKKEEAKKSLNKASKKAEKKAKKFAKKAEKKGKALTA